MLPLVRRLITITNTRKANSDYEDVCVEDDEDNGDVDDDELTSNYCFKEFLKFLVVRRRLGTFETIWFIISLAFFSLPFLLNKH